MKIPNIYSVTILLLIASLYSVISYSSIIDKSATVDEPIIITSGYNFLKTGNNEINSENPPILKSILAIPLLFMNIKEESFSNKVKYNSYNPVHNTTYGSKFIFNNDYSSILTYSRIINIIITILLSLFIYFTAKDLWGNKYGLLAYFLFLAFPCVLANGRLATLDTGISLIMFAFQYSLFKFIFYNNKNKFFLILSGIFLGLAMLSKFTGILIIPIALLQLFIICHNKIPKTKALYYILIIFLLASGCIFFIYSLNGINLMLYSRDFKSHLLSFLNNVFFKNIPLLIPTQYIKGFDIVSFFNSKGFPNIFLGNFYPHGASFWYYYIIILLFKVPIPYILLTILGFIAVTINKYKSKIYYFFIIPPVLIFLTFSFLTDRQLGIRYIIPIFPYIALLATYAFRKIYSQKKIIFHSGLYFIIILILFENMKIYPDYLAYFNQFIGSETNSRFYFADSNLDWGQDLPGLKKWIKNNNKPEIYLIYYGPTNPELYQIKNSKKPKYIAVSVTMMYYHSQSKIMQKIRQITPVGNIGYSIYIYPNNY